MLRRIYRADINLKNRRRLAKIMEDAICYLLDGELAKCKRNDFDKLTIWAEYIDYVEIIIDIPACDDGGEIFQSIKITGKAKHELSFHLNPYKSVIAKNPGRPVVYDTAAQTKVKLLRQNGLSIRKIAKEMGASTFTIQKLLKD